MNIKKKTYYIFIVTFLGIVSALFLIKNYVSFIPHNNEYALKSQSIDEIVVQMLEIHPNTKFGIEAAPGVSDIIAIPSEPAPGETEAQALSRVARDITKQTEYECRIEGVWLVVTPRQNGGKTEKPSVLRSCIVPSVKGETTASLLRLVTAARPEEPVRFFLDSMLMQNPSDQLIDANRRTALGYQLLTEIAGKLSERCWRVEHFYSKDQSLNQQVVFPIKCSVAFVSFLAPGEARTPKQAKK